MIIIGVIKGSWLSSVTSSVIYGFLPWYPKFCSGKIRAVLTTSIKDQNFHIAFTHPTNFRSCKIWNSGTIYTIWALSKYWGLSYALYNWTLCRLLAIVLSHDIPNQFFPDSRLISEVFSFSVNIPTTRFSAPNWQVSAERNNFKRQQHH